MDVRTLRYFVLVAEEGSIHGGARRALVAQPALSVALRKLERDVGAELFERSSRGIRLTPAGDALLPRARQVLHEIDAAKLDVRLAAEAEISGAGTAGPRAGPRTRAPGPAAPTSILTVGLIEGRVAAGELTGPILDAYQAAHPEVRLRVRELNFVEQFDAVLDGRVDVALVRSPYLHDDLRLDPLFSEPAVLAAGPDHPLARAMADAGEVALEDALAEPMLEVVRTPKPWREFWHLTEFRGDGRRGIPSHAVGLLDYCVDVMRAGTCSPMAQSAWRLGALGGPGLRAARLSGAPHSGVGVGYRRDSRRPEVAAFAAAARTVTTHLIDLVPDAVLDPAVSPAQDP